ncbi:MAG: hypothetical protein OXH68_02390, partial [Gammaproteobacteria bacterium]|nr:hypothetical protein [Gammaproteobacteria bacterium]
ARPYTQRGCRHNNAHRNGCLVLVWIIIGIVLVAAVGPVFWLMPSKRDRMQGELRSAARGAGLVVEIANLPKVDARAEERVSAGGKPRDATIDCVAYRLALARPMPGAPAWLLLRSDSENRYLPGWTTLSPPSQLPVGQGAYWCDIAAVLDRLPGGCAAVEADARRISWYGRERLNGNTPEAVVAGIREGLEAIGRLHRELDADTPKRSC